MTSPAFETFRRDVDFMWREATSRTTTQLVVSGQLDVPTLAMLTLQMFHDVKHTVPVFRDALALVPEGPFHAPLRGFLEFFATDEDGHDRVALKDLRTLGYDERACMETLPLPATLALHGTNALAVREYGPYYLVGETYATETVGARMSAAIHAALAARAELREGTSFYALHGEADVGHAAKSLELVVHALEDPSNRRPLLLGCLTAWRNLARMAEDVVLASRLYPAEFQLPTRRDRRSA